MQTGNSFDQSTSIRRYQVTANPAAGAIAQIVAPTKMRSELCNLSFVLTTDANVASRYARIVYTIGATSIIAGASFWPQPANDSITYICSPNQNIGPQAVQVYAPMQIFKWKHFGAGEVLRIYVDNIQAGDQISAIQSFWNSWIYP